MKGDRKSLVTHHSIKGQPSPVLQADSWACGAGVRMGAMMQPWWNSPHGSHRNGTEPIPWSPNSHHSHILDQQLGVLRSTHPTRMPVYILVHPSQLPLGPPIPSLRLHWPRHVLLSSPATAHKSILCHLSLPVYPPQAAKKVSQGGKLLSHLPAYHPPWAQACLWKTPVLNWVTQALHSLSLPEATSPSSSFQSYSPNLSCQTFPRC